MFRYTLFVMTVCGSFATAIAAAIPATEDLRQEDLNTTVIEKNQPFPVLGPLVIEPCVNEDCSDIWI